MAGQENGPRLHQGKFRCDTGENFFTGEVVRLYRMGCSGKWCNHCPWKCSKRHRCGSWGYGLVLGLAVLSSGLDSALSPVLLCAPWQGTRGVLLCCSASGVLVAAGKFPYDIWGYWLQRAFTYSFLCWMWPSWKAIFFTDWIQYPCLENPLD